MIQKSGVFVAMFVCIMFVLLPTAKAASLDDALKRMDEIIAEMQSLRAEFATLSAETTPAPAVLGAQSSSGSVFTESLHFGETNDDLKIIQSLLATDSEIYAYGAATGFFGPKTQEAIRNFQTRFGLDPVGVIGPSTRALLEIFVVAYPAGNFPPDVLKAVPKVQGASISTAPQSSVSSPSSSVQSVEVELDRGEGAVEVMYTSGSKKKFTIFAKSEAQAVASVAEKLGLSVTTVRSIMNFEGEKDTDKNYDDDDAEDAIDDAEDAIKDAEDEIDEADDDGDDVDWAEDTLKEAEDLLEEAEEAYDDEDWEEAVERAEEAKEKAEDAEDRIDEEEKDDKGDSDDIDSIEVDIDDEDDASVVVRYDDGSKYKFEVEEDKADELIEEIADELDMDEDDVEDLIEFDYGDVESIEVVVDGDEAKVTVEYESGVERRFTIDEDNEDDMIEEIADLIDEDEDDVEDWTDFD